LAFREEFQRLFMMSEPEALSLNAQGALGPVSEPERSQFSLLVRHFLERFFNHETASPDGTQGSPDSDRLATGLPGFVVALYLYPVYHPDIVFPQDHPFLAFPPPYWAQVNHHFFFVIYSFVAMGIITVFEWTCSFPICSTSLFRPPCPSERKTFPGPRCRHRYISLSAFCSTPIPRTSDSSRIVRAAQSPASAHWPHSCSSGEWLVLRCFHTLLCKA